MPRRVGDAELDRFLDDRRDWIARKLAETRAAAARANLLGLDRPDVVWLGLTPIPVAFADARSARLHHGRLVVAPGPQAPGAIERWYRREARERIGRVVAREAARLGVRPGTLAIRDPKTRWGSCSSRGTIGFSWRLVIAPSRCSSTSSSTSSVTCASSTTASGSGVSSMRLGPAGGTKPAGSASTAWS